MSEHLTEDATVSESTTTDVLDSELGGVEPGTVATEDALRRHRLCDGCPRRRRPRRRTRLQQLEREGEVAADFLETLLDICDLDGDIDVDIDGDRAAISVVDSEDGRVPRRMVGTDGNVLEALQEITRLAVQSATGERSRLMLDVAGHRAERRRVLVEIAAAAIARVKESGESQALEPMTAFERKVVHDEVLAGGSGVGVRGLRAAPARRDPSGLTRFT